MRPFPAAVVAVSSLALGGACGPGLAPVESEADGGEGLPEAEPLEGCREWGDRAAPRWTVQLDPALIDHVHHMAVDASGAVAVGQDETLLVFDAGGELVAHHELPYELRDLIAAAPPASFVAAGWTREAIFLTTFGEDWAPASEVQAGIAVKTMVGGSLSLVDDGARLVLTEHPDVHGERPQGFIIVDAALETVFEVSMEVVIWYFGAATFDRDGTLFSAFHDPERRYALTAHDARGGLGWATLGEPPGFESQPLASRVVVADAVYVLGREWAHGSKGQLAVHVPQTGETLYQGALISGDLVAPPCGGALAVGVVDDGLELYPLTREGVAPSVLLQHGGELARSAISNDIDAAVGSSGEVAVALRVGEGHSHDAAAVVLY